MTYGHFDNRNREYVITNPATPYPWINYLGDEDFFSLISNTAGGYSFYRDARLRRLTRYRYNSVPTDDGGRYFYINDGGDVWSPGWKPTKAVLDHYECRHGLGYTRITGSRNGVEASILTLVPHGENCEVQHVRLHNTGSTPKTFRLFSFMEFCLWNAYDDMTNFQRNFNTGEVEIEDSVIYHKTEYKERRDHYAFYSVNAPIQGYDTDRESFMGLYNGFDAPQTVVRGEASMSHAHGWSPVASHCLEVELAAGESQDYVFMLGYVENALEEKWESKGVINKTKARSMIERYNTAAKVESAMAALHDHWATLLGAYQIESRDESLDTMVNIWNQYQCMVTFNMSRSASFFESGIGRGMGFRDSNQDLIGFVHMVPERARQRILDIAATQLADGSAWHQYQPLTKRGNAEVGGNFNDDPLWLILSTCEYIKESGDFAILDEQVPFNNDETDAATLFEHLRRSFMHTVNKLGPHGLPLIGRADWNDCLNLNCFSNNPDNSFQTTENTEGGIAESLMIAGQFVLYGGDFAELCERLGKHDEAERARAHVTQMVTAIETHGWDGEWFLRAYDAHGNKIGSNENAEGKIFIESQGFCTMAGIGKENGKARRALDAVKARLDCEHGIVLNNPAFTTYHIEMGEISTYPEGYKENAGIFCHNNPWIMIGEAVLGNGKRAFEYYSKIAPAYLADRQELHRTEPYVYAQMIAGKDAAKPGEAKNSWLTGTAAWNFYAIAQFILGVRPGYDGLVIDPCVPTELGDFTITRRYRGTTYRIKVVNQGTCGTGVETLLVDGNGIDGNGIPLMDATRVHDVVVTLK